MYIQPFPLFYVNSSPPMLIVFSLFERKKSRVGPCPRHPDCRLFIRRWLHVAGWGNLSVPTALASYGGDLCSSLFLGRMPMLGVFAATLWMFAGGYGVAGEENCQ